jgi:hypothetical protein
VNITGHPLKREQKGVTFDVKIRGKRFGQLTVSQGGLRWRTRGKRNRDFFSWERFDKALEKARSVGHR